MGAHASGSGAREGCALDGFAWVANVAFGHAKAGQGPLARFVLIGRGMGFLEGTMNERMWPAGPGGSPASRARPARDGTRTSRHNPSGLWEQA
jgi:hypothetical protein